MSRNIEKKAKNIPERVRDRDQGAQKACKVKKKPQKLLPKVGGEQSKRARGPTKGWGIVIVASFVMLKKRMTERTRNLRERERGNPTIRREVDTKRKGENGKSVSLLTTFPLKKSKEEK